MKISNLKELLKHYPNFLDKSPTSNHYRVNSVLNNQYNRLKTNIENLRLSRDINRPIFIWKEQNVENEYTIHFKVNMSLIRSVKIYIIDPLTQNYNIINSEDFSYESETNYYTYDFVDTCDTIIPVFHFLICVYTWDEFFIAKGFPENDKNSHVKIFKSSTRGNSYTVKINVNLPNIKEIRVFQLTKKYGWNLKSEKSFKDDASRDNANIEIYSDLLEDNKGKYLTDLNGDFILDDNYTFNYLIVCTTYDDYLIQEYFGDNSSDSNFDFFNHDEVLDFIGKRLNIPRRTYIRVNPTLYSNTNPSFCNRFDEDDYTFYNRIKEYIETYPSRNLSELEVWKYYGIESNLVNRKWLLAEQDVDYMWEDGCVSDDENIKLRTIIEFESNNKCVIGVDKKIIVHVTYLGLDDEGNLVSGDVLSGTVSFTIDGLVYYANVHEGKAYIYFKPTIFKIITVSAEFNANEDYDSSDLIYQDLIISKRQAIISAKSISGMHGDTVYLRANVKFNEDVINEGIISFSIDGEVIGKFNIINNSIDLPYTIPYNMPSGSISVKVSFNGNPNYFDINTYLTLYVRLDRIKTFLSSISYQNSGISLRLYDELSTPLDNLSIYVYKNTEELLSKIKSSRDGFSLLNNISWKSDDVITAEFKGDLEYYPCNVQIFPLKCKINPKTHIDYFYLASKNLRFQLRDSEYKPVVNKQVYVRKNGHGWNKNDLFTSKNYTDYTLDNYSETDVISIDFDGDDEYDSCTSILKTVISTGDLLKSRLWLKNYTGNIDEKVKLKAVLTDNNDNPINNQYIIFKINDVVIGNSLTDTAGTAELDYILTENGTFNLEVVFEGSSIYTSSSAMGSLVCGFNNTFIKYLFLKPYLISVRLYTEDNISLNNKLVLLLKNNILVDSLITNSNGFGSFINTGLYVASDDLELIFEGEGQFNKSSVRVDTSNNQPVVLKSKDTVLILSVDASTITTSGSAIVTAQLLDYERNNLFDKIIIFDNGTSKTSIKLVNGFATYTFSSSTIGNYTILASFLKDEYYNSSSSSITINVVSQTSNLTTSISFNASSDNLIIGNTYKLTSTIKSEDTINIGTVSFLKNDTIIGTSNIIDNIATMNFAPKITDIKSETQYLTAQYSGTSKYLTSTSNKIPIHITINTVINLTSNSTSINTTGTSILKAKLTDSLGNNLIGKSVSFYSENEIITTITTDNNGECSINFNKNISGTYNIKAVFNGGEGYNASISNSQSITVYNAKTNTNLTIDSLNIYRGQNCTVTLKSDNNTPLSGCKIYFKLGGTKIYNNNGNYYTTDSEGKTSLYIDLSADTWHNVSLEAFFIGNDNYNSSSVSGTLTINKMNTNINISSNTVKTGENLYLTLKNSNGAGLSDCNVYLSYNGSVFASATTNTNGIATIPINMTTRTVGTVIFGFDGNDYYNSCTGSVSTFNVISRSICFNSNITANSVFNQGNYYTCILTDCSTGNLLSGKSIELHMNRISNGNIIGSQTLYPTSSSSDGKVTYQINYSPGTYSYWIKFNTDGYYETKSSESSPITFTIK